MDQKAISKLIEDGRRAGLTMLAWRDRNGAYVKLVFKPGRVEGFAVAPDKTPAEPPVPDGGTERVLDAVGDFISEEGKRLIEQSGSLDVEPDWCACGHALSVEHNPDGLCLLGCTEEQCKSHPATVEKPRGT